MKGNGPPGRIARRHAPWLALLAALWLTATAMASVGSPRETDDSPSGIVIKIGRCFASILWDFGIGGFVIQLSSCSLYIPIQPPEVEP